MARNATLGSWGVCMGYIDLPPHVQKTVDNGKSRFNDDLDQPPVKKLKFELTEKHVSDLREHCIPMLHDGKTIDYMHSEMIRLEKLPVDIHGTQFQFHRFESFIVSLRKELGISGRDRKTKERIYNDFLSGKFTHKELAAKHNIKLKTVYAVITKERKSRNMTREMEKEVQNEAGD